MGIVAHFYMDVELQSVLQALPNQKRVKISDSLVMGDAAVKMCQDGATSIACLGVDFMSESVLAIMAKNGEDEGWREERSEATSAAIRLPPPL